LRVFRSTSEARDPRLSLDAPRRATARGLSPRRRLAKAFGRAGIDESGQSVVEFGMVVPLLCTLVLVLVDFGKAMNYWLDATHVANQIAREAAVNSPDLTTLAEECAQLETGELRHGSSSVDPATITITYPEGSTVSKPVRVEVAANYKFIPFIGRNWTIRGSATMRLEHDATNVPASGTCS
jgi:Flp pilus assembly protein TadG